MAEQIWLAEISAKFISQLIECKKIRMAGPQAQCCLLGLFTTKLTNDN